MNSPKHHQSNVISETDDVVHQSFLTPPPMVVCFVRHLNRSMEQVETPASIEHCVVELQSYFQPFIEAGRVTDRCLPGSRLCMQFGKAIDVEAGASSLLLNLYILAVDQDYSRPRVFAQVVKEWRARLEKAGREGNCFVMLYHKDLVDVASVSARIVCGESSTETHNQEKANAAVATLETYFDELRALKFDPHQMCTYLPTDAPIRVMERLRVAYVERTAQLSGIFESYQQQRQPQWSLRECWRRGYDLVKHFLQFSVIDSAAAVLSRMFDLYYYNSEDYSFLESRETLAKLGCLSDIFCPVSVGAIIRGGCNGFPDALGDDLEFANGLAFITACEIRCLLLLGRRDAAFSRVCTFLQVAREKLSEPDTAALVGDVSRLFFMLRCLLSTMRLQWRLHKNDTTNSSNANNNNSSRCTCSAQVSESMATPLMSPLSVAGHQVLGISSPHRREYSSCSMHTKDTDGAMEAESDESDPQGLVDSWKRWEVLCALLGVDSFDDGKETRQRHIRRLASLASSALEILIEMGELLGYYSERIVDLRSCRNSTKVLVNSSCAAATAAREEVQSFGMPELMNAEAFIAFYRTLAELAALSFRLSGRRQIEHDFYYRLALSHLPDNPTVTAKICQQRLIPFILRHGWLQLQGVVHRLYVDTMDIIVTQRQAAGLPAFQKDEEALMLREALLRLIHAIGTECVAPHSTDLANTVDFPTHVKIVDDLWSRFCNVDTMLAGSIASSSTMFCNVPKSVDPFSLLTLFSNTRIAFVTLPECGMTSMSESPSDAGFSRAQIGDTVELRLTTDCLVSAIASIDSGAVLAATVVSKKDWTDLEEPVHTLPVTEFVSALRDAETGRVSWTWTFSPCHAGAYRLRSVSLFIAGATLIYTHNDGSNAADDDGDYGGIVKKDPTDVVLIVPEPEIGIQVRVIPPAEPHCFGDALSHITVLADIEKPLYLPRTGHCTPMRCSLDNSCASITSRPLPPTRRALSLSLQSGKFFSSTSVGRFEMTGLPGTHPRALAVIFVSRARRAAPSRPCFSNDLSTSRESNGGGSEVKLFVVNDESSGSATTVPVDERWVMSQVAAPALSCRGSRVDPVGLHVDGHMLSQRQQCCYNICVRDEPNAACGSGELLDATSLRCELPLLPLVMAPGEDTPALVSLHCQRDMESCSVDVTVPLRFAQAFAVQYAFQCTQSRVYCTVRVENVLPSTSLWLRGALLDLLDAEPYYTLARVSSTYERLTTREWRAGEVAQLLFELAPTTKQPHANTEEVQHRVRLQLFYSRWSATEGLESLVPHTLRPFNASVKSSFQMLDSMRTHKASNGNEEHTNDYIEMETSLAVDKDDDEYSASMMGFSQQPILRYDPVRMEELHYKCNTFYGPVATFTSRYSCLFNAILFLAPNDAEYPIVNGANVAGRGAELQSPVATETPVVVFPAGEPLRFSVLLEPLAHNWPEGTACEEEFIVSFVADPAAWLVTGRQNVRTPLSMMDDATFCFTAVPVPPVGGEGREPIAAVATPSVEIRWAARPREAPVATEVVQFRTSMLVRL